MDTQDLIKKLSKKFGGVSEELIRAILNEIQDELNPIHTTSKYSIFKKLEGNRIILENRVKKIMASIQKVGYIRSPLIVNEKMEVIDGQGRLEALQRLDLPVDYIIQEGIGINECIAMNINQGNWALMDYVESYATRGLMSYVLLKQLIKDFPEYTTDMIATAIRKIDKMPIKAIQDGTFTMTNDEYNSARIKLQFFSDIVGELRKIKDKGNISYLIQGLLYCYTYEPIKDKNKLKSQVIKNCSKVEAWGRIDQAILRIEEMYNYGLKLENKICFSHLYKQDRIKAASLIAKEQYSSKVGKDGKFKSKSINEKKHPFTVR